MAKYRAIPQGFMTVGEVAKKMGVTVRTLQYYDKEGLLSPSAESGELPSVLCNTTIKKDCFPHRQKAKADAGFIPIKI